MLPVDAAIAANRFGYGARPGDLERLGSHARDNLLAQLKGPAPLLADVALPSSRKLLSDAAALRQQASMDKAATGGKKKNAPAPPADAPAGTPNAPAAPAAKLAKLLRETYVPHMPPT